MTFTVQTDALRSAVSSGDQSCRTLSHLTRSLEQMNPRRYKGSSHGLIGSLLTGKVRAVNQLRAAAIETALSVQPGSLFAAPSVHRSLDSEPAA